MKKIDGMASNSQLAISPTGDKLLVTWNDGPGAFVSKVVELNEGLVKSIRDIPLPDNVIYTAFSSNGENYLVSTWEGESSNLLKINVKTNEVKIIYKSLNLIRFPIEVSEDNYVFLEEVDHKTRLSQWQRLDSGKKTVLNGKNYTLASQINKVGESLFILEPSSPPQFRNLYGKLPPGVTSLIEVDTFSITCADTQPLTCLRKKLRLNDAGQYYGIMEIINDETLCRVPGEWIDSNELRFSRDGAFAVFHAAVSRRDGPRAVFLVKNSISENACTVTRIEIKGE